MTPNEVDTPADVKNGTVPHIKNAAVRKLQHELGIQAADPSKMKFLTRLHYWAADTVTHGPKSPWGEHEIDYVLFWAIPSKDSVKVEPNPEEIQHTRWVNAAELEEMLEDEKNLFSPWFRLIYYKWLKECWWKDLKVTMTTDKWTDYDMIHEFDPPVEHLGGGGNARPLFSAFDERYVHCLLTES
jgi:isopentenyl-diphosphate delta-isomerase type 1